MKVIRIILSMLLLTGMIATLKVPVGFIIEEEHHVSCSKNSGEENGEDESESRNQKRAANDYISGVPGSISNPGSLTDRFFPEHPEGALQLSARGYTAPPPEIG